ncbi:MAG: ATP-dependent dethiobiotin synthetase BioD, partial [Planctomycetia bacterium]
ICRYRYRAPLAPPLARRWDLAHPDPSAPPPGKAPTVDDFLELFDEWSGRCEYLLVEGVGGLLCPLTETATVADLATAWRRPVVVVARRGLGTINHTLLTMEAAQRRNLDVRAVVVNSDRPFDPSADLSAAGNADELRRRLSVPVVGPLPHQPAWNDGSPFPKDCLVATWFGPAAPVAAVDGPIP